MKKIASVLFSVVALFCLAACGKPGPSEGDGGTTSSGVTNETITTFFNVGAIPQVIGSAGCTIIEDSGQLIVVDAGMDVSVTEEKITQFLRKKQYTKIDHMILTHAHDDHAGGMPYLIDRFDIGTFYYKPCSDYSVTNYPEADKYYTTIVSKLQEKTNEDNSKPALVVPTEEVTNYRLSDTSNFTIYYRQAVFDSDPAMFIGDKIDYNAYSFGVKFITKHTSIYIGGDSPNYLDAVLLGKVGHCQIMAAPHHGTTGPYSSQALINEIMPEYTVVQGMNVNFGTDTRARYEASVSKIYTNEDYGSIIFTAKNGAVTVKTEKEPN